MTKTESKRWTKLLWSLLAVWFLVSLLAGYIGVFGPGSRYSSNTPLPLGLAALLPLILFGVLYRISTSFRDHIRSLSPVALTAGQTGRVIGIVFLIFYAKGLLPRSFAFPAGFGDVAIGLTAPWIAWAWARKKLPSGGFLLWQLAGLTDLAIAVTLGVLASFPQSGNLPHAVTTQAMGLLPMSLIPTFGVPLYAILHLICIVQVRQAASKNNALPVPPGPIELTSY